MPQLAARRLLILSLQAWPRGQVLQAQPLHQLQPLPVARVFAVHLVEMTL